MSKVLLMVAKAFDTKGYPDDKNPDHWRKINGSPVHLDANGHIDGGAGGKFKGTKFGGVQKASQGSSKQAAKTGRPGMFEFEMSDEFKHKILSEIEKTAHNVHSLRLQAHHIDAPWPGEEGYEEKTKQRNDLLRRRDAEYHSLGTLVMWMVQGGVPSEEIRAAMEAGKRKSGTEKYD